MRGSLSSAVLSVVLALSHRRKQSRLVVSTLGYHIGYHIRVSLFCIIGGSVVK